MEIITVAQVLKEMETGRAFDLTFVTYDRRRKGTGGELRSVRAVLLCPDTDQPEPEPGQRPPTRTEANRAALDAQENGRNPNHSKWYTRNIVMVVDGHVTSQVRTVHPPLFAVFNGRTVVP
jgi:hypothetical protein